MRSFFSAPTCKQAHPLLSFPAGVINLEPFNAQRRKEKVVVVMGATGTGKSKLSIDLATRFPSEIVNSDKMQMYQGLDIVTNKVTEEEQSEVPHHLLGVIDPDADFDASDFSRLASLTVESVVSRNRVPIVVGGSNSYIESLVDDEDLEFRSKYECCFLWVDVALPVLHSFVSERVDRMVQAGLVDEVRRMFEPDADYNRGIRRAIGVPEMDRYLRAEAAGIADGETRARLLEAAIDEIKVNTCKLACCQVEKIKRLRSLPGWHLHRLDATDVFLKRGGDAEEAWELLVAGPSTAIVRRFLHRNEDDRISVPAVTAAAVRQMAVAAATR